MAAARASSRAAAGWETIPLLPHSTRRERHAPPPVEVDVGVDSYVGAGMCFIVHQKSAAVTLGKSTGTLFLFKQSN